MQVFRLCLAGLLLAGAGANGQDRGITIIARGSYTTGSELFPDAGSVDPVARARTLSLDGFAAAGAEVRYTPPGSLLVIGLSADYLRASAPVSVPGVPRSVPAEDGFLIVPLELTGYFNLPIASRTFGVIMGGGAGLYIGKRIYRIAGVEAVTLARRPGFGIHVLGGIVYRLTGAMSLHADMKFRDAHVRTTTAFPVSLAFSGATPVPLDRTPVVSRIHADGVVFQLGAALTW